ncbi:tetratricopeptide repeat protein [Sphingomonas sp. URHD0057]|uniref:tetratricopeptide repeat protein n=1 Tax=Sphingomonas sp. URHD0057 TaxID=1380389 RepID=UPI000AA5EF45|nr:tetratricopeptide repeat protein [Sphingomonas sp. URHD0057]
MKLLTYSAIALVAALSAVPAAAQPNAQSQIQEKPQRQLKPSAKALKPLSELQTAVKSKDPAAIQAKLAAAQAVVSTNDDRFILAQLQLQHAADLNDTAAAMNAMDAMLTTGVLQPAELGPLLKNLSGLRFNAKQYDQAAAVIDQRLQLDPNDLDAIGLLAETRNAQGRTADAVAALQRGTQVQTAAGRKPDENWVKRTAGLAYSAKLPNAPALARQWVAAYPSPKSWKDSIAIYRNLNHPDTDGVLDLLRLASATGALTDPNDYQLYASASAQQGNYVEALAILNQGAAAKHIDLASASFRDMVAGLKAKPQATEADLAEAVKTAPPAATLIRIGDRYYGLGNYAKAVETYRAALAKPGADAEAANLHIGMALARSGDKADAAAALNKVGGSRSEIAKYWLLYTQT